MGACGRFRYWEGGLGAAVVNNRLYAVGGKDGNSLKVVEVFNPETNTWASEVEMSTARGWLAVVAV